MLASAPQPSKNESLLLRHDRYHTYVSSVLDSGDAMDATFILRQGCSDSPDPAVGLASGQQQQQGGGAAAAAGGAAGGMGAAERRQQAQALLGGAGGAAGGAGAGGVGGAAQRERAEAVGQRMLEEGLKLGETISLEAMGMPGAPALTALSLSLSS